MVVSELMKAFIMIYSLLLFLFLLGILNWRFFNTSLSGRPLEIRGEQFWCFLRWFSIIITVIATTAFIGLLVFENLYDQPRIYLCILAQLLASFALLFGTVKRFTPIPDDELERQIEEDIKSGKLGPIAERSIVEHREGKSKKFPAEEK